MAFTAKDVQALREKTGVGMMDCKKALVESDGDMDKAIDILREKGLAPSALAGCCLRAVGGTGRAPLRAGWSPWRSALRPRCR